MAGRPFPDNLLLGVSTAAFQIEGAWDADGKGESMWDRMTHTNPDIVINRDNGDVACDSYYKYKEDVQLIKQLGFQLYKFSISWTRILPTGEITNINQAGIDHYDKLIDELLENDIEPMVTLYHWDLPQNLHEMGGWLNPLMVNYFEDYARLMYKSYGHKVKWWITINEPLEIIHSYTVARYVPCLKLDHYGADYIAGHTLLLAHARAYRLYDEEFRETQKGKVSITVGGFFFAPKTKSKEDEEARERAMRFDADWFIHPIYSEQGDYSNVLKEIVLKKSLKEGRKRSKLPQFTDEQINKVRGSYDFLSLNHYTSRYVTAGLDPNGKNRFKDADFIMHSDPSWPSSNSFWLKPVPWGMSGMLLWITERYGQIPIFITENGFPDNGQLDDIGRLDYYRTYISEVLNAIDKGCNVIGYCAWSLMDNFEWLHGYSTRFGIVHVDFEDTDRKRTLKSSAAFFKELTSNRELPDWKNYNSREELNSIEHE